MNEEKDSCGIQEDPAQDPKAENTIKPEKEKKKLKKKKVSREERHENCFPDNKYYYLDGYESWSRDRD